MIKYVSIDDIVNDNKYPFTKGQLRHFIANRKKNGLITSIRKIGKRIYIREDLFDEWIESFTDEITIEDRKPSLSFNVPLGDIPIGDNGSILRGIQTSNEARVDVFPFVVPKHQNVIDIKIDELDFSVRTMNCLEGANINTFKDLIKKTKSELLLIRNMGKKSMIEIENKVNELGCYLKE